MATAFTVTCPDGRPVQGTKFSALGGQDHGVIVINSALGIRREFYRRFAESLAAEGFTTITWDPRGMGDSAMPKAKFDPARMRDWAQIDLNTMLHEVVERGWAEWEQISVVGHSAGAHLVGLCPAIVKIPRLVFIAAGTCTWRLYPKREWLRILIAWYLYVPVLIKIWGYAPAELGVGHDLPKGIVMDWRNWSLSPDYLFSDPSLGRTFYDGFRGSILCLNFTDDIKFSPERTVADLLSHFPLAQVKRTIIDPLQIGVGQIGHFGFFREKNKGLWRLVSSFITL